MLFISDSDTRPAGAAHPLANLWDNGSDPVAELRRTMQVRRIGLNNFGLQNISMGTPLSELELQFLPLYLHHRYQLTAAVKSLGGVYYSYAVKTENSVNPDKIAEIVPAQIQREALKAVLETIKAEELAISENVLKLIPPMAYGYGSPRAETFPKRTDPVFDPLGAAEIAADLTIQGLLEPGRAARMITFHARDKNNPHFREVVDALLEATWKFPVSSNNYHAEIERAVQSATVTNLMNLAANANAQPQVRAVASDVLRQLSARLKNVVAKNKTDESHYRMIVEDIERFLTRPDAPRKQTEPLLNPPGDPIGN